MLVEGVGRVEVLTAPRMRPAGAAAVIAAQPHATAAVEIHRAFMDTENFGTEEESPPGGDSSSRQRTYQGAAGTIDRVLTFGIGQLRYAARGL